METTLKQYTVKEVCEGFVYNEIEGKGLFGLPLAPNNGGTRLRKIRIAPPLLGAGESLYASAVDCFGKICHHAIH